jgi:dephospho-CoA kinase
VNWDATRNPSWRLGLTGGIGSGKSTVARMLQTHGATVIDADAISRACTAPNGRAILAIATTFGAEFVAADGSLDRERMRTLVFQKPSARQALEAIVHPLVGDEIKRQTETAATPCIVFDIPLLAESPRWRKQLDRVLVVDCLRATQSRRVQQRSGWSDETIDAAIRNQATRQQRLASADVVVYNDGLSLEQLQHEVAKVAHGFRLW